jgi:hypothetical protein
MEMVESSVRHGGGRIERLKMVIEYEKWRERVRLIVRNGEHENVPEIEIPFLA